MTNFCWPPRQTDLIYLERREGMEEAKKVVLSEKEGNAAYLSGEVIMESVRSTEEEVNLNTPVPAPFIIHSSSSSPPLFSQVSYPYAEEANGNVAGEGEGTEEARKFSVSEN